MRIGVNYFFRMIGIDRCCTRALLHSACSYQLCSYKQCISTNADIRILLVLDGFVTFKTRHGLRCHRTRSTTHFALSWLVGCFGFNGPLRQYFSLYRAVSQREGEREEKG